MPDPLRDITDIRRYSNALRLVAERRMGALTERLTRGELTLAEWQEAMKAELRRANLQQFVTGRGGVRADIYRTEYLKLGTELSRQYRYLDRFAQEIEARVKAGGSIDFAVERAKLYAKSTQAIMWRAAVPVGLPQVPRDGKTRCRTNCKCRLDYKYERNELGAVTAVLVWWKLRPAEHCEDCVQLSREWRPLRVEALAESSGSMGQAVAMLLTDMQLPPEQEQVIREVWGVEQEGFRAEVCEVTRG